MKGPMRLNSKNGKVNMRHALVLHGHGLASYGKLDQAVNSGPVSKSCNGPAHFPVE